MVRDRAKQQHPKTKPDGHINWFATVDSGVEGILEWDVKAETFAEAVLGVLAAGNAIMLGVSMAGDAVSVTIYAGDNKQRKWVTDSVEFDDLMAAIWQRGRAKVPTKLHIPAEQAAD